MHTLRSATSGEVAESWVRGETESDRFGGLYAAALANRPHLTPVELLAEVRGWPSAEYLEGLPTDVSWSLVELDRGDLHRVLYMDWDYWNDVSGGTRLASEAIARMGWTEDPVADPASVEPLILITDERRSRIVVLEGHSRLTHYLIAGDELRVAVPAYLGVSASISDWWAF